MGKEMPVTIVFIFQYFAFLIPNLSVLKLVSLTLFNQAHMTGVNYFHRNASQVFKVNSNPKGTAFIGFFFLF